MMRPVMRSIRFVVPALLLLSGCEALDPSVMYREAAQKLHFTLDHVEPSLELAFPLDQSRVGLRLTIGVDNPTDVRFEARSIMGQVILDEGGASHGVGELSFHRGVNLAPHARTPIVVDLTFAYRDLNEAWGPLRAAIVGHQPATWRLVGQVQLDVLGFPVTVPFRAQKHVDAGHASLSRSTGAREKLS